LRGGNGRKKRIENHTELTGASKKGYRAEREIGEKINGRLNL